MKLHGKLAAAEAVSLNPDTVEAANDVVQRVTETIGASPDLAVAFFSPHHIENCPRILDAIRGTLGADHVVGVSASGVIGGGAEHQTGPGLSLWAARLPGTRLQPFHLWLEETDEGARVKGWPDGGPNASAVILADPFSFPLDPFLASLRQAKRAPALIGGIASGASQPGGNVLICDEEIHQSGAVGFVMDGAVRLQPFVTQGCSAVGRSFKVTRCERNVIHELDEQPAAEVLQELMEMLPDEQRERFRNGPQLGVLVGSQTADSGGNYLIRGIIGMDAESGSVTINDLVIPGRSVQFFARDGKSAAEDMDQLLGIASGMMPEAAGALLFSCNGRGSHMFGEPGHDIAALRRFYPDLPVAGLFAAGEIGPICGQPYLHGFTASAGLLVDSLAE